MNKEDEYIKRIATLQLELEAAKAQQKEAPPPPKEGSSEQGVQEMEALQFFQGMDEIDTTTPMHEVEALSSASEGVLDNFTVETEKELKVQITQEAEGGME
ncbi:hypothetical protein GOP47_0020488 [Adiantum capillus-veneris]|uniref:Uncharacterized protein n=1 Tax=Adiantum capillus-veneris TaxID=13818 RepID=A0A9D4Z644_ADICA|nr:hypothetical protein GOP47_0020488 [Adiantum capillus-veneris]